MNVNYDESYLVLITSVESKTAFYVLIPNRKDMGEMLSLMSNDKYVINSITLIGSYVKFDSFLNLLKKDNGNKPEGLYFGQN